MENMTPTIIPYDPEANRFETLGEFKIYLSCGANVAFEWNGVEYGVEGHDNSFIIWICNDNGDLLAEGITLEQALDFEIDGTKIRDLILKAEITERMM